MAYEFESELESLPELEAEFEEELEDETEDELEDEMEDEALEGEGWLGTLGSIAGSLLGESEDEYESEEEFEDEAELSPIRKIYPDAMMEHLGELAAEAETEDEAAEHFLPLVGMAASKLLPVVARAVAPMAKRALPKIAKALTRSTPQLTRGIGKVAKALHRNPKTRHLLRAVPGIARRTVGNIAHKVARGGQITPRTAARTLAHQTQISQADWPRNVSTASALRASRNAPPGTACEAGNCAHCRSSGSPDNGTPRSDARRNRSDGRYTLRSDCGRSM